MDSAAAEDETVRHGEVIALSDSDDQEPPGSSARDDSLAQEDIEHFTLPPATDGKREITCERRGPAPASLVFTHGAGGTLSAPACAEFTAGFATASPIVSFNGTMHLGQRVKSFRAVASSERTNGQVIALGGRSMGARAACVYNTESPAGVKGMSRSLVLVSYPLMGANGTSREDLLLGLQWRSTRVLFISGSNDSMCPLPQLRDVMSRMKTESWLCVVEGANHGMDCKPKKVSAVMRRATGRLAAEWLKRRDGERRECKIWWDGEVKSTGWVSEISQDGAAAQEDNDAGVNTDGAIEEDAEVSGDDAEPQHKKRKPTT